MFSKESGTKPGVTVSDKYRIQLKKSINMNYIKQFYGFFHIKLFYNVFDTSNEVLSFFHRWDFCWKCKVNTYVKKELDVSPWWRTIRFLLEKNISKHKAEQKGGYSCSLRISRNEEFIWQKSYSKQNQMSYLTWRKLTYMNRNWTGKLQVTVLFTYIFRKKLCPHTFKASLEEVIVMRSEKMKAKYMKGNVQKQPPQVFYKKGVLKNFVKFTGKHLCQSLFLKKLPAKTCKFFEILKKLCATTSGCVKEFFYKSAGWHLATSLRINFFTDIFQVF